MQAVTITQINYSDLEGLIKNSVKESLENIKNQVKERNNEQSKPDYYMTRTEVSEYLSVTRQTLQKWNREGVLNCSQIGVHYRYKKSDVDKFMDERV